MTKIVIYHRLFRVTGNELSFPYTEKRGNYYTVSDGDDPYYMSALEQSIYRIGNITVLTRKEADEAVAAGKHRVSNLSLAAALKYYGGRALRRILKPRTAIRPGNRNISHDNPTPSA